MLHETRKKGQFVEMITETKEEKVKGESVNKDQRFIVGD